jgi:hypothetical protein
MFFEKRPGSTAAACENHQPTPILQEPRALPSPGGIRGRSVAASGGPQRRTVRRVSGSLPTTVARPAAPSLPLAGPVCRCTTIQGLPSLEICVLSCPAAGIDEARCGKARQRGCSRADATLPPAAHWIKRNGNILLPIRSDLHRAYSVLSSIRRT